MTELQVKEIINLLSIKVQWAIDISTMVADKSHYCADPTLKEAMQVMAGYINSLPAPKTCEGCRYYSMRRLERERYDSKMPWCRRHELPVESLGYVCGARDEAGAIRLESASAPKPSPPPLRDLIDDEIPEKPGR